MADGAIEGADPAWLSRAASGVVKALSHKLTIAVTGTDMARMSAASRPSEADDVTVYEHADR